MPTTPIRSIRGFFRSTVAWIALGTTASLGQDKPPASAVPEPYRQKFVRYVDRRTITEKALNLIGLNSQDVGRGFALIAGVSKYPNMPELKNELPAAAADIDALQDYLKNQEFFDEIVVLRDGDVTSENLEYFLQNYFPDRLRKSPKARFLFAYSGHGMTEGVTENQTGYLLKSTARGLNDKSNSINMSVLRVYLDQVIDAGYQTLALINACHSGAFLSRRPFGDLPGRQPAGGFYFPKNGGAHAITAGGSHQLSWHEPKLGKGSVFFEKLLAGLGGQADTFPIYPDGHRGDGVITVDEIATYLREEVSLATNQQQIPILADLALNRSLGGFFFLSRQKMVANGIMPEWNPRRATSFGVDAEETLIIAKRYFEAKEYQRALPVFQTAAQTLNAPNAEAAAYLGFMHQYGLGGLRKDDAEAVVWYRRAAHAGNADGMSGLGFMYDNGLGGLPKDQVFAVSWYRGAAEAGSARAMNNLGVAYENGEGGVPKDEAQAVEWYRKAADAGYTLGMNNLGAMYEFGRGGLRKDETQAVSWYRKAADAGDADGMTNLGLMYEYGRDGLPKDEAQAVSWYRKAADAGDEQGMYRLGFMYENGRGGLPKAEVHAMNWYRKAAQLGNSEAQSALRRLGSPAVNDVRIAKSVPSGVIPQDPIRAVADFEGMRNRIKEVIRNKETITFLISWPKDDNTYLLFVSNLLSSACRESPRQCWFTQQGSPRDLDRPPVQGSSKPGIIVHGPDANALAAALANWFETYSTSSVPSELNGYKEQETKYLIWIDIGPGSPWKQ